MSKIAFSIINFLKYAFKFDIDETEQLFEVNGWYLCQWKMHICQEREYIELEHSKGSKIRMLKMVAFGTSWK
jgi:hypothetical protein